MEQEREDQLYRLQADLCQVLADPTRLKLLTLLGERPRAVKALVIATGERQAKISQHLAIMASVALRRPNEQEQKCITPLPTHVSWKHAISRAKSYSRN
jgi:DNA-binding transcriptional ArsR family regulator